MVLNSSPARSLSLCYCYAHEDAPWLDELDKHLAKGSKSVQRQSDRDISEGGDWRLGMDERLATANLLLLLVTENLIDSGYCDGAEMQEALSRHEAGEVVILPVLLQPVDWEKTALRSVPVLPHDGQPITTEDNMDEAFEQIATEVDTIADEVWGESPTMTALPVVAVGSLPKPADELQEKPSTTPALSDIATTPLPKLTDELQEKPSTTPALSDIATVPLSKPANGPGQEASSLTASSDIATIPFLKPADEPGQEASSLTASSNIATIPLPKLDAAQVSATRTTRNPYKGLRAFTASDAEDFFGRATSIDELALLIESMPAREKKGDPSSRLLAVIGPAGTGKSSVVMAGLIPSLRAGGVFDSADWVYLDPIVPGEHPIVALAQTLLVRFPEKGLHAIHDDLQYVAGLHLYSSELIKQAGAESTHVVLVIDQFEEFFTLTNSEEERRHFVNLLVNACTRQEGSLIVILTLRADFVPRLAEYPGLAALARLHQATLSTPTQDDLRAIITQPANLPDVSLTLEEGLADALLSDAQGLTVALPHVQFTLSELFRQGADDQLTLQAYRELGGVKIAIAQRAEQIYRALPSHEHRLATYALFLSLVDLGTVQQGPTPRWVKQSELTTGDHTQTQQIQESLDAFVNAGLLHVQNGARSTVKISHEIVMRAWPRLAEWLRMAREDKLFQQTFTRDVAEWEQREQAKTQLYRGAQLKKAQAWATRHTPNQQEAAFLQASASQRSRSLLSIALIALLLVALLGVAGGYYASRSPSPLLVTNTHNSGTGSLRWSINNAPTGSTITFDPRVRGAITLTGGNLAVGLGKELTINGPGAGRLTLRSGDTRSTLVVPDGSTLTVSGLSFQGSKQATQSVLSNHGMLTINNSIISGNSSSGDGGGIYSSDGILTLNNSVVSGNTANGNGGGLYFFNGTLTLNNSTIAKNTSSTGNGGGLYFISGILTMRNSTIASNSSIAGGGIYAYNDTLTLTNDTIGDNAASSNGGGIFSYNSTLTLDKSTVFNNTTASNGGGISVNSPDSPTVVRDYPVVLERSIVAGNHAEQGLDVSGTVITRGYNLFEYFAGANFVDPQRVHATDKEFNNVDDLHIDGVLDKNGGSTLTHALLAGSPAVDAIPVRACDLKTAATDQRGVKRPQGGACDIGAYEYQAHP